MKTRFGLGWLVVLAVAAAGCGASSTIPTGTPTITLIFTTPNVGTTFSAQVSTDSTTITTAGTYSKALAAGTYTITGTFIGPDLMVGLSGPPAGSTPTTTLGGVQAGTVKSLSGPATVTGACTITYDDVVTPQASHAFSIQFTIIDSNVGTCQA